MKGRVKRELLHCLVRGIIFLLTLCMEKTIKKVPYKIQLNVTNGGGGYVLCM